jgi:hypothetical protein
MAGAADLGKLFGKGGIGEQLLVFGLLQALLSAGLAPELQMLTRAVNEVLQATPLAPELLADLVVRNIVSLADATAYAKQSGTSPSDFLRMVHGAGAPPSPQELIQALRRGVIPHDGVGPDSISFQQGIAESRLYNKWRGVLEELGNVPLPVADAVDAVVEGQISHDQGAHFAYLGGVSAEDFQILVNTRGNPPSPTELVEMLKRGLIPLEGTGPDRTTVQQGIFEGATKDKWWELIAQLGDYLPPPRTVTALVREGAVTDAQALSLFQKSGLSQELAAAYLHSAHHQKLASTKELAKADVDTLYHDQLIDAAQADAMYGALGFTADESAFLRAVQDVKRSVAALNGAISRIRTLYVAHKIDRGRASAAMDALGVPPAQRDQLMFDWDVERSNNVKVLTAPDIASAYFYGIIDQDTAIGELVADGWNERDAWILLSVRKHAPQPNPPEGLVVPSPRG